MFKQFASIVVGLSLGFAVQAQTPKNITFNNQTDLALHTSISGLPGQGVPANTVKTVDYYLVKVGCYYSPNKFHCPIEFTDKKTGAKVATVYINSETATLTEPPRFYGAYANEYEVIGWEASPLKEITITKKA